MVFEKQEIKVIAYKIDYQVNRNSQITIINFLPSADSLEMVESGIREIFRKVI